MFDEKIILSSMAAIPSVFRRFANPCRQKGHVILILAFVLLSTPCFAAVDQNLPNAWHVRVDGDDNNEGHSYQTGLATINAAVAASADGDTIYIWPGDYNETVDLDASNKALTLIGMSRSASRITHYNNSPGIKLGNGCVIKNLSVILTGPPGNGPYTQAVVGISKSNCTIEDCDITGAYDGLHMPYAVKPIIKNCRISSGYDALFLGGATDFLVDNCILEVSNSYSTITPMRALIFYNNSRGVCRDVCIFVYRNDAGAASAMTSGIEFLGGTSTVAVVGNFTGISAMVVVENFTISVSAGKNVAGNVYGVYINKTGGNIILSNGVISAATTGSGSSTDIYNLNSTGTIAVQNIIYSNTSGAITQGGSGWSEAVTHYADPNYLLTNITKYIMFSGYNKVPVVSN